MGDRGVNKQIVPPIDSSLEGYTGGEGSEGNVVVKPQTKAVVKPQTKPVLENQAVDETTKTADETTKKVVTPTVPPPTEKGFYQKMQEEWQKKNDADDEAIRKRRKRSAIFGAIGDGISALSNLYFASKGAPNMYDAQKNGMLPKMRQLWDQEDEKRKAERDKYYNAKLAAIRADDAKSATERDYKLKETIAEQNAEQKKQELALKREIEERQRQLSDARIGRINAQNNKDDVMAAYYKTKQECLEAGLPLIEAEKRAKIAKDQAAAYKSRTGGGSSGDSTTVTVTEGHDRWGDPQTTKRTTVKTKGAQGGKTIGLTGGGGKTIGLVK